MMKRTRMMVALLGPTLLGPAVALAQQAVPVASNTPVAAATGAAPASAQAVAGVQGQVYNGPPGGAPAEASNAAGLLTPTGAAAPASAPQSVGANSVPTSGVPLPSPLIKDPVALAVDQVAPLDVKQVQKLKRTLVDRDSAMYRADRVPSVRSQLLHLDLSPSGQRPVIHIAQNIGGTVSFIDIAGNPWPIEHVDNFGAKGFQVSLPSGNTISVWGVNPYMTGNVAVVLKGLASPVSFLVAPPDASANVANDRTDLVVPRVLPDKRESYLAGGQSDAVASFSDELTSYLLRTPPDSAKSLRVVGLVDSQAWQTADGALILRTSASLRSPAWIKSGSAADGTHVYKLPVTPLVTVADTDGRLVYVQISGYDSVSKISSIAPVNGSPAK
ncbi:MULTISPECIES: DotH/IcmK family type IV secretion protein [unclassified Burkholderia]|uniref:DotH/IcmK family type IV secretion protein n=1 Tax=unclassified Burkholderia TaxID=2613784 RepID=UPI002AB00A9B|nr:MULTISPECIES: DotH/IcmK family type IV secretion protein [unclassified Burkholderia]